jgi:hypothetical protein
VEQGRLVGWGMWGRDGLLSGEYGLNWGEDEGRLREFGVDLGDEFGESVWEVGRNLFVCL